MTGRGQAPRAVKSKPQKKNPDESVCSEADNDEQNPIFMKLEHMTKELKNIRGELKNIVKKEDVQHMIDKTITEITKQMESKIMVELQRQLNEKFEKLNEEMASLRLENENLKDSLEKKVREISDRTAETNDRIEENKRDVNDAIKMNNHNEQYSRKNNVKMMNVDEEPSETEETLVEKVGSILASQGVTLKRESVVAIHRLPTKNSSTRPVIMKLLNNSVKTEIMRKRKELKSAGNRIADDVTRLNTTLINRLSLHEMIDSAWFFNGSVFGKTIGGKRVKFDIFDDVALTIAKNQTV